MLSIDLIKIFSEFNDLISQPEELLQQLYNLGVPQNKLATNNSVLNNE